MDDLEAALLDGLGDKANIEPVIGRFIRVEQGGSIVVVSTAPGKSIVRCKVMSTYRPEPLEPVAVLFIDGVAWYLGAAQSRPGRGVVTAVSGGLATVAADGTSYVCSYSTLPTVGNQVRLSFQDGPHIAGVVATFPDQQVAPPDPAYVSKPHTFIFKANMSGMSLYPGAYPGTAPGTFSPGGFLINSGLSTWGRWFYGPAPSSSIPVGATITSTEIYFPSYVGFWGVLAISAAKSVADANATAPTGSETHYSVSGAGSTVQTGGTWLPVSNAFGTALTAAEVSVLNLVGGASSGYVQKMDGLDLLGDGQGDNLSGAIRITAVY